MAAFDLFKDYTIGLGIITYNRPEFCNQAWRSAWDNLKNLIDYWILVDDGSSDKFKISYDDIGKALPQEIKFLRCPINRGVAAVKNEALKYLMDNDCDFLFLMEDDIQVLSPKAITEYIEISLKSGYEHLMFSQHGNMNIDYRGKQNTVNDDIEFWPACVGAWTLYTKNVINTVGYMDEELYNYYEHCYYSAKISHSGLTGPLWSFADIKDSYLYLMEQPNAIESSVIRADPEYSVNIVKYMQLWQKKDPDTFGIM